MASTRTHEEVRVAGPIIWGVKTWEPDPNAWYPALRRYAKTVDVQLPADFSGGKGAVTVPWDHVIDRRPAAA